MKTSLYNVGVLFGFGKAPDDVKSRIIALIVTAVWNRKVWIWYLVQEAEQELFAGGVGREVSGHGFMQHIGIEPAAGGG